MERSLPLCHQELTDRYADFRPVVPKHKAVQALPHKAVVSGSEICRLGSKKLEPKTEKVEQTYGYSVSF